MAAFIRFCVWILRIISYLLQEIGFKVWKMGFDFGTLLASLNGLSASDHQSVVSINLFVALICACIVIGHLLEENRWMNESITALIIVSSFLILIYILLLLLMHNELDYICLSIAGSLHWSCHSTNKWRKELTYSSIQRRSFLHLPSSANHF